jgi:hypothetical protein
MTKQTMPSSPTSIINFLENTHTESQQILNEITLIAFQLYSISGLVDIKLVYIPQEEVLKYMSISEALNAIESLPSKLVTLAEFGETTINILYKGPFYSSVTYEKDEFVFEANAEIKPYWKGLFKGLDANLFHFKRIKDA